MSLLGPLDPHPVRVSNPDGASRFLLVADHAGRRCPAALGDLGLEAREWERHIAVDIGIRGLGGMLARELDAALIEQRYSRLVIDCNRPPGHPSSVPVISERTTVPGNQALGAGDRAAREAAILHPYQRAIAAMIERRRERGRATVLIALHSFTPVYEGRARPWHAGVLHDGRGGLALAVLSLLRREPGLVIGDNEPYCLSAVSDYTVPLHAWPAALDHVELEVRQDLIAGQVGQAEWSMLLARVLGAAE